MENTKSAPDFLIIGSMKSGTTTLYSDLAKIEQFFLPADKEPSILSKYESLDEIRESYKAHFSGAGEKQICGEASTVYTSMPMQASVVDKAYELCGQQLKLIMIMRDPIERIISHLRHDLAGKHILFDEVNEIVLQDPRYVAISNYPQQIKPWVNRFGSGNLYCVSFLEYIKNRSNSIKALLENLGINADLKKYHFNNVENKSADMRFTGKNIASFINSDFYKRKLRNILPDIVRNTGKKILLPKSDVKEITLSMETMMTLRSKLSHVENEIRDLTGREMYINNPTYWQ